LLKQLDTVIAYYKRLDLDSANIQPAGDVKVYASVNKSISKTGKTRYLVELQPRAANQASAREVQATLGSVRKLFSPGVLSEKAILEIIGKLQESVTDPKFQQDLLNMRSSPNFKDMIANLVVGTLSGVAKNQDYSHKNIAVASKKIKGPDLREIRAEAKKKVQEAEQAKKALNKKPAIRTVQGRFTSLVSLRNMLDSMLHDQIQRNMGTGNRRDVLNYRTGRFAQSAKITNMSQSREGMITTYYTYMRNPYATFSAGGAQSAPPSRDPKHLISKSIREVLAAQVKNRLRAVLV
jgi:hypothetical protein